MDAKPVLLIMRKLSDNAEARAARDYDVRLNPADQVYDTDELLAKCEGVDAVLPCHSEHFSADVVGRLPDSVKIIANHSVGTDHCDLEALAAKGVVVTNTPDVLSDATAEIAVLLMLGAAGQRGRPHDAGRHLGFLEPVVHGRHPGDRQALRDHRHGPRRSGHGATRAWFRHGSPLL